MAKYFVKVRSPNGMFNCECDDTTLAGIISAAYDHFGACSVTILPR